MEDFSIIEKADFIIRSEGSSLFREIAILYFKQGKETEGEKWYNKAIGLYQGLDDSASQRLLALTYRELAEIYIEFEKKEKAIELYEKIAEIHKYLNSIDKIKDIQ